MESNEQIQNAIAATRGGWQDSTEQQRRQCWQAMTEDERKRALQLASLSDLDRAKFLKAEREKAHEPVAAPPVNKRKK